MSTENNSTEIGCFVDHKSQVEACAKCGFSVSVSVTSSHCYDVLIVKAKKRFLFLNMVKLLPSLLKCNVAGSDRTRGSIWLTVNKVDDPQPKFRLVLVSTPAQ